MLITTGILGAGLGAGTFFAILITLGILGAGTFFAILTTMGILGAGAFFVILTLIIMGILGAGAFFLFLVVVLGVCYYVYASGPVTGGIFAGWQAGTGGAIAAGSMMAGIQSIAITDGSTATQVVASGVTGTISNRLNRKS